jgi:hypothetical protein
MRVGVDKSGSEDAPFALDEPRAARRRTARRQDRHYLIAKDGNIGSAGSGAGAVHQQDIAEIDRRLVRGGGKDWQVRQGAPGNRTGNDLTPRYVTTHHETLPCKGGGNDAGMGGGKADRYSNDAVAGFDRPLREAIRLHRCLAAM